MAWIKARFEGKCCECETPIHKGDELWYEDHQEYCENCGQEREDK